MATPGEIISTGDMVYYGGRLTPSDTISVTISIRKIKDKKHFVIKAGCETLVVHNFTEAQRELFRLFKKEYKDFFNENNKST